MEKGFGNTLEGKSIQTKSLPSSRVYRFYPIYSHAFIKNFAYMLYGLALPNYLLFQLHISPSLLGILYAIYALAYIFGPFLCKPISNKFGIRDSTLVSGIISSICVGIQLLTANFTIIFFCRLIDGIFLGAFWPNMYKQISKWEEWSPPKKADEYFKKFTYSWNFGCIFAEALGFIVVFIGKNDFLAIIIAWFFMLMQIPAALLSEKPSTSLKYIHNQAIAYDLKESDSAIHAVSNIQSSIESIPKEKMETKDENAQLVFFPFLICVMGMGVYACFKALTNFTFPLYLLTMHQESSLVYFIIFFQQILQLWAINYNGKLHPGTKYRTFLIGLIVSILFCAVFIFSYNLILISIAMILTGIFTGFLYSFVAQVMIQHGKVNKNTKASVYFETFSGLGYGITPLLAGFVAEINFRINFYFLATLMFAYCLLLFKIKKETLQKVIGPSEQN